MFGITGVTPNWEKTRALNHACAHLAPETPLAQPTSGTLIPRPELIVLVLVILISLTNVSMAVLCSTVSSDLGRTGIDCPNCFAMLRCCPILEDTMQHAVCSQTSAGEPHNLNEAALRISGKLGASCAS
eukprot:4137248-Amphidinium_carterae.1